MTFVSTHRSGGAGTASHVGTPRCDAVSFFHRGANVAHNTSGVKIEVVERWLMSPPLGAVSGSGGLWNGAKLNFRKKLAVISYPGIFRCVKDRLSCDHRRARGNSSQSVLALPLHAALRRTAASLPLQQKNGRQLCLNPLAGQMPQCDWSSDKRKMQSRWPKPYCNDSPYRSRSREEICCVRKSGMRGGSSRSKGQVDAQ